MTRTVLILLTALAIASCGVQRPLIKPSDIPAHQAAQQRKREKIAQEELEQQQMNAAEAAGRKAIEDAQK